MPAKAPHRLQVCLLGPLRVVCSGREVAIGSARQRAVLVALSLSTNRVLSLEALIALLWEADPPHSAKSTVHSLVSRLRRDLAAGEATDQAAAGPLRTSGQGYVLDADPADVDALAFLEGLERGRRQLHSGDLDGADTLRQTLRLWRGAPLPDLAEYRFARVEADRLAEARLGAVEELAEAELARGRPHDALSLSDDLVATCPLRERAWASRILALYRLGRQADALAAYRELRHVLREELGADPTPELRELELAVIRQDPALRIASALAVELPLPPELTAETGPFVGRGADVETVERFAANTRRTGVVWLLGAPGIGKTRLATHVARRAHERGAIVLFGRCTDDLPVPYHPFRAALQWFGETLPADALPARLGTLPEELGRLAPEVCRRAGVAAPAAGGEPDADRLFEAVRSWLAGQSQPVVFVLDDLQWAPAATLALLGHLCRSPVPSRLLVVATARTTAPDDSAALASLADSLGRHGVPSCRVELGGLEAEQVRELVGHAVGRLPGPAQHTLAADLHAETGGHPLFVTGVLASLSAGGVWDTTDLPQTLAESIRRRVDRLPEPVGRVLRIAALIGLDFDLPVLAVACGQPEEDVLNHLEEAVSAGLLDEVAVDRLRFAHALVRTAMHTGLTRTRAARLHLAIARAIEAVHAAQVEEHAVALAHHYWEARSVAGREPARRYARLAAEQAVQVSAYADAAVAYGRALELLDVEAYDSQIELLLAQGRALKLCGAYDEAVAPMARAARAAAARGDAENLVRAAADYVQTAFILGRIDPVRGEMAELAMAGVPDRPSGLRALALGTASLAWQFEGRREESEACSDRALGMARAVGARDVLPGILLSRITTVGRRPERAGELLALTREALTLLDGTDRIDERTAIMAMAADAHARLGDLTAWDEHLALHAELGRLRLPFLEHIFLMRRHMRAMLAGELAAAEDFLCRAEDLGHRLGWGLDGLYAIDGILLRREQGRLPSLAPALRAIASRQPPGAGWEPGLAFAYACLNMQAEAREHFERAVGDELAAIPTDDTRPAVVAMLAEVCARVEDAATARRLLVELLPLAGTLAIWTPVGTCFGPVDRLLANLEVLQGDLPSARERMAAAVAFSRGLPSPLWTARCLHDLAALLPSNSTQAHDLLAEADGLCRRFGLAGLGAEVDERLRGT